MKNQTNKYASRQTNKNTHAYYIQTAESQRQRDNLEGDQREKMYYIQREKTYMMLLVRNNSNQKEMELCFLSDKSKKILSTHNSISS